MAMRRESGRAFGSGPKPGKKPTGPPARPKQQSSLGDNAARAHGYTQKGPTRRLKPAPKPKAQARTPLRQAYRQDVAEEGQKGSPAQRGAVFRRSAQASADKQAAAKRKAAEPKPKRSLLGKAVRLVTSETPKALAQINPATKLGAQAVQAVATHAPRAVDRELSGQGVAAKQLSKLAENTVKHGFTVSTGGGPNIAGQVATRGKGTKRGGRPIAAVQPQKVQVKSMPKGAQRALEDFVNFPAAAPASVYEPAKAAIAATKGDTKPAKKLIKQIKDTDPLYAAATGDFKKAGELAAEHPGFTALEVVGAKGAAGRAAGRVIRGTGRTVKAAGRATGSSAVTRAGENVRRVAATDTRPAATRPGIKVSESRAYSRDVTTKAGQVLYDRRRTAKARKLHRKADQATDPDLRDRLRDRANRTDPLYMSDKALNRHVDLQESAVANRARRGREDIDKRVTRILKKAGDKGGAQVTVLHGITKADIGDLRAYRAELQRIHPSLEDAGKRRRNEQLRKQLDVSIKRAEGGRLRRLDMEKVAAAAREYSAQVDVPLDKRLADLGLLDAERGARAKLVPFAAREMGARTVEREPLRQTVRDAKRAERQAAKGKRAAQRRQATAERRELRERGASDLLARDAKAYQARAANAPELEVAVKEARSARSGSRKAQRTQLSQYERAGRARGRAEIIVNRSADVRSGRVKAGDATRPRRTLARLLDERSEMALTDSRVVAARKAEAAAEAGLQRAQRRVVASRKARRAERAGQRVARRVADVENAKAAVARAEEKVTAAKAAREAAELDARRTGLANPDNSPLDYEQVAARAAAERAAPPSYLSQGSNARGARNYYTAAAREPTISSRARTERATTEGTFDANREVARASAIHRENIANAAEGYRESIAHIAHRDSDGKVKPVSYDEAVRRADDIHAKTGQQLVPVQFEPWRASSEQRAKMREALGTDDPRGATTLREGMVQALEGKGERAGSYVLVPKAAATRMAEHLKVLDPSDLGKVAQSFRSSFSRTVLSTSLSPMFGNLFESGLRAAVARSGGTSLYTMHQVIKRMTPEQRAQMMDRVFTGGKVTLAVKPRHFDAEQIQAPTLRKIAAGWGAVKRTNGPKQLAAAWQQWTHFMTAWMNGKIERGTQYAMAGKALRDSGLLGDGVLRLSDKAFDQAARGLTNTAEQNRLADTLVRDFGKYDALSPAQRRIVGNYAPFAAWWWSSARFVGTLPINHPALTALLASNSVAVTDFKKLDATPAWLRGTRAVKGMSLQMARNTPFGAFTEPIGTVGSLILPQGQSLLFNAQGRDWKGDPLRNPDGSEYTQTQLAMQMVKTLAESAIPVYAAPKRAIGYAQDPGSLANALRVRTKPKAPRKKKLRKRRPGDLPDLPALPDLPPLPDSG